MKHIPAHYWRYQPGYNMVTKAPDEIRCFQDEVIAYAFTAQRYIYPANSTEEHPKPIAAFRVKALNMDRIKQWKDYYLSLKSDEPTLMDKLRKHIQQMPVQVIGRREQDITVDLSQYID